MRIAHFTDVFLPNVNGIVTSVINNSEELAARGHQMMILTSFAKGMNKHDSISGLGKNIAVKRFRSVRIRKWDVFYQLALPGKEQLFKELDKFKPDILHVHTLSYIGWLALAYSKKHDIPVIATYHSFLEGFAKYLPFPTTRNVPIIRFLLKRYLRSFLNRCDIVISPSNAIKKYLIRNNMGVRIETISNGVDTSIFYPRRRKNAGKTLKIVHIGRVGYEKNLDMLIDAFDIAQKRYPDMRLDIIGPGREIKKLKRHAKKLKLEKHVVFKGYIPYEKLPYYYSDADMLVIASNIETEGLVVLEAMACGLPVIGVDSMALPDIIKTGFNGLLVKPDDKRSMAEGILKLAESRNMRKKMSANALRSIKEYSIVKCMNRLERVYHSLLKSL